MASANSNVTVTSNVSVSDIVTDDFFNGLLYQGLSGDCPGRNFYTRTTFLDALNSYNHFGQGHSSADDSKREIAAFFAHVSYETKCVDCGRVVVILENSLPLMCLNHRAGIVATDPVISFKTALWFWMINVHQVVSQGFGATIRAINGGVECNGTTAYSPLIQSRIQYYIQYCNQFGVASGDNLGCN
ncbi:Chitinase 5 [Morella rubra]|uniref:chitinase n=1 Tax=Morella rubra TaxID=262757 RepID=A0A6A1WJJ7_9ROSI|nr:Chitinase 5 [Morella rubra]